MHAIVTKEQERKRRQAHLWMTILKDIVVVELSIDGQIVWDYIGIKANWHEIRLKVK